MAAEGGEGRGDFGASGGDVGLGGREGVNGVVTSITLVACLSSVLQRCSHFVGACRAWPRRATFLFCSKKIRRQQKAARARRPPGGGFPGNRTPRGEAKKPACGSGSFGFFSR